MNSYMPTEQGGWSDSEYIWVGFKDFKLKASLQYSNLNVS